MSLAEATALDAAATRNAIEAVVARHGAASRAAAERGVRQVAARWTAEDGDATALAEFCAGHFVADAAARAQLLDRLERAMITVSGHLYEIRRDLRWWTDVRTDTCAGVDDVLAKFDPAPDLSDQLYRQRIGFLALLNFPRSDLAEMLKEGGAWSVDRWAESRLAQSFGPRIPSALSDRARRVGHEASVFVSGFHVPVETLVDASGARWLPAGRKLLAHWLVREEVKANYGDPANGLARQRALMWVMARHIDGTIPASVMDGSNTLDWDSERNTLAGKLATNLHGPQRYRHWLAHRDLAFEFDRLYPEAPTAIARKFDLDREIPETEVERLLTDLLGHPVMTQAAAWLRKRLGRELEPQDIYFEDIAEVKPAEEMNAAVKRMFPDEKAFERKLPEVLKGLGFKPDEAEFLGSRIRVEIARGSGHAMRPGMPEYARGCAPAASTLNWAGMASTPPCTSSATIWSSCAARTSRRGRCCAACRTRHAPRHSRSCTSPWAAKCSALSRRSRPRVPSMWTAWPPCWPRSRSLAPACWNCTPGAGSTRTPVPRPNSFATRCWPSPSACGHASTSRTSARTRTAFWRRTSTWWVTRSTWPTTPSAM
ncbi:MAG: hypothetical protein ACKPEA_02815 [Planctomycetota bacterium]